MMAATQLKQVVGYVEPELKEELMEMKRGNRRLSESALVERAIRIAMPTLRKEFSTSFKKPTRQNPGSNAA